MSAPPAPPPQAAVRRLRGPARLAIGAVLLTLAAVIASAALVLRGQLRAQILSRDAALLAGLARFIAATDPAAQALGPDADPADRNFALLPGIARFDGVLAARLFEADGAFAASIPDDVTLRTLGGDELAALRAQRPVVRFDRRAALGEVFIGGGSDLPRRAPLRTVLVPLAGPDGRLSGAVELVLEGHSVAAEFAVLDRRLAMQAASVFLVSGAAAGGVLAWAFARLARRTAALQQANAELARQTRAAAVGAVAAHLMHSLKNPLAGLRSLADTTPASGPEREEAVAAARRMETLIHRVTGILREEADGLAYEVTLAEVFEDLRRQFAGPARRGGVALAMAPPAAATLDNRTANLLGLALANLVQNALEAAGPGRRVAVAAVSSGDTLAVEVSDDGPGLPEAVRARLYTPVTSTKPGGAGIGLALSWQLLHHAGAALELIESSAAGTRFRVRLTVTGAERRTPHAAQPASAVAA